MPQNTLISDLILFVAYQHFYLDEVAQRQRATAADEAYVRGLLQSGVMRACPSCRTALEKNGGCLHMSCSCGHQFWYENFYTTIAEYFLLFYIFFGPH